MNTAYLLLGSNAGDRTHYINTALKQITGSCGSIAQTSHLYETAAWGLTEQPDFLNMVTAIDTRLTPRELLKAIQTIENELGRQRDVKWGQRTLDIDILFYNSEVVDQPDLQIPHPHMQDRRFVLMPLAEIAADLMHPALQRTVAQLLDVCPDTSAVKLLETATEI